MTAQPSSDDLGAAFAGLRSGLRAYLRRRLPDPAQADDLVQDVFVKALASKRAGRTIGNLGGWLYAATRTTLADHYRSAGLPVEALDDDTPEAEADDTLMHQRLATCLRPFIGQLAPLYRDTLIATEFEGKSMRSLAQAQGVSVSAIKSRAARARAMLREKLLACCHVEVGDSLVSDFRRKDRSACGGNCASD